MTSNGACPSSGAIRYTYNAVNQLNKIETHNGSAYSTLAQMAYDGIGSRMVLTGWVSGVAYTTTYASRIAGTVQILQATSGANSTSYLYGLNQIGEFGLQSVYYLADGAGSIRHLVDPNGAVKLARIYEPFGQVLMQAGTGDPIYSYLGAQYDRISGLLYINGRYYDPVTGRFLSPSSSGSNPYVPLGGAALAPILILALLGRRKKGKIWTGWVVIALMMSVGLTLVACDGKDNKPKPPTTAAPLPKYTPATPVKNQTATPPAPPQVPLPSPTATCTPTPNAGPSPTPGHPAYTQEELDVAAKIVSGEVGTNKDFRGPDTSVRAASILVAWTLRNRVEVGEQRQGSYDTYYQKAASYTEAFQYYDVYKQLPPESDPISLQAVIEVFNAPSRVNDPINGAIFEVSLDFYIASGRTDAVKIVKWVPVTAPTPAPGTPDTRHEFGVALLFSILDPNGKIDL